MTRTVSDVMGECYEANDPGGYDPVSLGDAVSLAWDAVGQRIGDAIILALDEEHDIGPTMLNPKGGTKKRIPIQYVIDADRWEAFVIEVCNAVLGFPPDSFSGEVLRQMDGWAKRIASALIPNLRRAREVGAVHYEESDLYDGEVMAHVNGFVMGEGMPVAELDALLEPEGE